VFAEARGAAESRTGDARAAHPAPATGNHR
jgi:hypothetical protein